MTSRIHLLAAASALVALLAGGPAAAYPLDAAEPTGIDRLEAYRLGQLGREREGRELLPKGALLPSSEVRLSLLDRPDFEIPAPDRELGEQLRRVLGADARYYSLALLDLTDPEHPRYAGVNPDQAQNPGSVGKIMAGLGLFQALADLYPDDLDARRRLLYETQVTADGFIRNDDHVVPFWKPGDRRVDKRPIQEGDVANLWTWLDWMLSSSSNAAASEVMAQLVLLRHFGREYPAPAPEAAAYFAKTPKAALTKLYLSAMIDPIGRNGLDRRRLQQGSFFTREGKTRIPGTSSIATAGELLRYLVRMEQGRLVDAFSSLELKRLLYLTDQRIRYASQPALADSALYFKSGSLYSCKPEAGFQCGKFLGNRLNFMNSMVLVETHGRNPPLRYAVAVLSNVLKKNSAEIHEKLALEIHRAIEAAHPVRPEEPAQPEEPVEREIEGLPWLEGAAAGGATKSAGR
jgi:hypothetical protein